VVDTRLYACTRLATARSSPVDGLGPVSSCLTGRCVSTNSFNASAYCNNKFDDLAAAAAGEEVRQLAVAMHDTEAVQVGAGHGPCSARH
jgi:hypothetical protein